MADVEQTKRPHFPSIFGRIFPRRCPGPSRRQPLVSLLRFSGGPITLDPSAIAAAARDTAIPTQCGRSSRWRGGKRFVKTSVSPRAFIRIRRSVIAARSSYSRVSQYVFLDAIKPRYGDGHSTVQFQLNLPPGSVVPRINPFCSRPTKENIDD